MKKIPFDIKYKRDIISGKVSVVTRNDKPVKIISWDATDTEPIAAIIDHDAILYHEDGIYDNTVVSDLDLFILTDEFERAVKTILADYKYMVTDFDAYSKNASERLMEIAKKDLPRWRKVVKEDYGKETRLVKKCDGSYTLATDHTLYPINTQNGKASKYYIPVSELEKLPII